MLGHDETSLLIAAVSVSSLFHARSAATEKRLSRRLHIKSCRSQSCIVCLALTAFTCLSKRSCVDVPSAAINCDNWLQVFYVDFGNTETLSTTRLRADPICTNVPAQAFDCVLSDIRWVCSGSVVDTEMTDRG